MLLDTLGASLFGNMFPGKGIAGYGNKRVKKGQGTVRADYGTKIDFQSHLIYRLSLRYRGIIRMNPDLMVFIQLIICLIK